jgi:cell division protein FtsW (lipid II flippase)
MNITLEQQRKFIIWLSGLYGLLVGIILLFFLDIREGIESWLQLFVTLLVIVGIVLLCNYTATRFLMNKSRSRNLGRRFWTMFISLLPVLLITAFLLTIR